MSSTSEIKNNIKVNFGTKAKVDLTQLTEGELVCYTDKGLPIPDTTDSGKVVGVNANGEYVLTEGGSGGGGNVTDVKIDGTSIVTNKVANIPIATSSTLGVVIPKNGLQVVTSGNLNIVKATDSQLEAKNNSYNPIVSINLDKAIMEGLGNNSLSWSTQYKANARTTIGAGTSNFSGSYSDLSGAPTVPVVKFVEWT